MINTSFASALFKTHLVMLIFEDTLVIVLNFGFWGAKTAADLMLPILLCCSCMWQLVIYKELFVHLWHPPSSVFKKIVLPNSPGQRSSCEASCYLWLFACLSQCFQGLFLINPVPASTPAVSTSMCFLGVIHAWLVFADGIKTGNTEHNTEANRKAGRCL